MENIKILGELNSTEWAAYYKWCKKHNKKKCNHPRKSKSLHFIGTGIGLNIHVFCECGKVKDITDYESW